MIGELVGAAVGLGGSLLGGSSQPKVKWRPMATDNMFGSVAFDKKNRQLTQSLAPWAQDLATTMQGYAGQAMGSPLFGMGQGLQQLSAGDAAGAYGAVQNYGMMDPSIYAGTMQGLGQYANLFGGLAGGAMQNPYAMEQMQFGRDLMGAQAQDYSGVMQDRLGLLRQQAAPFEERALNSLATSAFGRGRLGSTGGGRDLEAFGRGLSQADTSRQLDAMGFAEQLYGRDQANATALRGMGANMFGGGVGNYLQGLNASGQFGQLGMGALGGMYDLGMNWNQAGYTRANERLARTSDMFGFGSSVAGQPVKDTGTYLNLLSGIAGEQANLAQMGLSAAGPGAPTGGNTTGQAVGGFLQGLGGGMLTGDIDPSSWFKRGGSAATGGGGGGGGTFGFA